MSAQMLETQPGMVQERYPRDPTRKRLLEEELKRIKWIDQRTGHVSWALGSRAALMLALKLSASCIFV